MGDLLQEAEAQEVLQGRGRRRQDLGGIICCLVGADAACAARGKRQRVLRHGSATPGGQACRLLTPLVQEAGDASPNGLGSVPDACRDVVTSLLLSGCSCPSPREPARPFDRRRCSPRIYAHLAKHPWAGGVLQGPGSLLRPSWLCLVCWLQRCAVARARMPASPSPNLMASLAHLDIFLHNWPTSLHAWDNTTVSSLPFMTPLLK